MKITVIIYQRRDFERAAGTFAAYVQQDGRRGENLLGRLLPTDKDTAIQSADKVLMAKYGRLAGDPPAIDYVLDLATPKPAPEVKSGKIEHGPGCACSGCVQDRAEARDMRDSGGLRRVK